MSSLVGNALCYARAGGTEADRQPVDAADVLDERRKELAAAIDEAEDGEGSTFWFPQPACEPAGGTNGR
jgi:hypothetical protein